MKSGGGEMRSFGLEVKKSADHEIVTSWGLEVVKSGVGELTSFGQEVRRA